MIILHSSFLRGRLFVWGETPDAQSAAPESVEAALRAAGLDRPLQFEALSPGGAQAVALEAAEAVEFLAAGAAKSVAAELARLGPDTAFWTAALDFCASLVVRQRIVQAYALENSRFKSYWKPIFTGDDERTFRELAARLPGGDPDPDARLTEFLREIAGHLMRTQPKPAAEPAPEIPARPAGPFRLCFRLEEPETPEGAWRVSYLLQSTSDPTLLLPPAFALGQDPRAPKIMRRETYELREKLLTALDRAGGICPDVGRGQQAAADGGFDLDARGAHDFLTLYAAPLDAAGFGVMLPAWWTRKGRPKLAARARASRPDLPGAAGITLNDAIDLDWELALGEEKLTREELDALAKLKEPLVRLRGRWVEADGEAIRAAMAFWKKSERSDLRQLVRMSLGGVQSPAGLEMRELEAEGELGRFLDRLKGKARYETLAPPKTFAGRLRPYQVRGFSWLAFLRQYGLGACLADDMGLGKTVQALALILSDHEAGVRLPVLIACPLSVVSNWKKEAERFTPGLSVLVHHGVARDKAAAFKKSVGKHDVVVTSYALLARDFETLRELHWGGVILDEAQNIKNPRTLQAGAARALTADFRIALTGTPVENHVGELWSIMEFLNPGLLGTAAEFKSAFLTPIEAGGDQAASERLSRLTRPFLLRRLKTDKSIIRDLPEKQEMKVYCNLTKEQAALYAAVGREAESAIEGADGIKRRGLILAALTKLKQVCNHPAHFLGDNSKLEGRSGKLARLTEMLEEVFESGERALVFTQYAEMGFLLQRHLTKTFGGDVPFLHGGVARDQRDGMVARFQAEGEGPRVFVLSLKAGGTGLNLTRATHVFHYDRWWNPAVENQATDRAYRIGQTKNVQVHKFICAGTLEEKIDAMLERKTAVAERIVGAGEGWLTELSNAELRQVFALSAEAVGD